MIPPSFDNLFASEHEGRTQYLCAAGCKRRFDAHPEKVIPQESGNVN